MRLSRLYLDAPLAPGRLVLPDHQAHYVGRVLRLQPGHPLRLFDGRGSEFHGVLVQVGRQGVEVELTERVEALPESPLRVHLGQGLSRGERMDWAIQKATELGVAEITPIVSQRCEVRLSDERADKRLAHWRQVASSACEQCGRSVLPLIHPPALLDEWLATCEADLHLVLHPQAVPLARHPRPTRLSVLVGPEGGLSEAEVARARQFGHQPARLGPRTLRTETAAVVALALTQQLWGDLGTH